jgi:hypothetical protein
LATQGVKLINPDEGDSVIDVAVCDKESEDQETPCDIQFQENSEQPQEVREAAPELQNDAESLNEEREDAIEEEPE